MDELEKKLAAFLQDQQKIIDFLRARDGADHDLLIKLDTRLMEILERQTEMLQDHEERLRVLEEFASQQQGSKSMVAMIVSFVSLGLAAFVAFFKKP